MDKDAILREYIANELSIPKICDKYGITQYKLNKWVKEAGIGKGIGRRQNFPNESTPVLTMGKWVRDSTGIKRWVKDNG